jgi:hypothetical protein
VEYKVLDSIWWNPLPAFGMGTPRTIGIVAVESWREDGGKEYEWKCYIGLGVGLDQEADEQFIAGHGQPLANREAAAAFFSQLDPNKYRY